jgi:hypothetical protein
MVGEPAVWPDPDPGWRVRVGCSLVEFTPMSDERRELIRRESEREAQAAELEAQQARDAAYEKRWMLERQGVLPVSVADRLAAASFGMDRQDKIEERREREAAELLGKPRPTYVALLREAKAEREAKAAEAEETPVSQAEFGRVVSKLKTTIENTFGKRLLK